MNNYLLSTSGISFPIRLYHATRQAFMNAVGIGFMAVFLLLPGSSVAGALDSPAATTAVGSAMFTITNIYDRLNTGATVTKRAGGFTEPAAGPTAGTGHTLDEVMTLVNSRAHAICNTAGGATLNGTRWCDNGDGTVTDLTTGLIWLKAANWGGTVAFWVNTSGAQNAHDKAASLAAGAAGASLSDGSVEGDWRLPTLKELKALTASGTEDVFSGTMRAFTGVQAFGYWSSTTNSANTANARYVNLFNGNVLNSPKTNNWRVWPVRGK